MSTLYLGLMSGTSLDGIDACLVNFGGSKPRLIGCLHGEIPESMRHGVLDLAQGKRMAPADIGALDAELGERFAHVALSLLRAEGVVPSAVKAIGSHGQTVWHQPSGAHPFSFQIGDPARIAERTGITTVADFRRRDIAAGGQGAPLVPAFHAAVFRAPGETRVVLNLGGMANVTVLPGDEEGRVTGFDTGPGNVLLDLHARAHLQTSYDTDGALAGRGRCDEALLEKLLADEFFALPPPKSTGRERFNATWLKHRLRGHAIAPADLQATLAELTARSVAEATRVHAPDCTRLLVCGGGVHNRQLIERIAALLPDCSVGSTAAFGVEPDWVEAMAFAWLARQTMLGRPGNLPAVTGASHAVILGCIHPGAYRSP